jgi:hypothetical protein
MLNVLKRDAFIFTIKIKAKIKDGAILKRSELKNG